MLAEARYDAVAGSPNWRPSAAWTRCWWPATCSTRKASPTVASVACSARWAPTPALGDDRRQPRRRAGRQRLDPRHPAGLRARQCACAAARRRGGPAGANLAVLAPLTQRHTYDDVTQAFDLMESEAGRVRVGLAHGSVTGRLPDTIDATNPIAADCCARGWTIWRWATGTAACGWTSVAGMRARPSRIASGAMSRAMCWTCASLARARRRRSSAWPWALPLVGLARDAELADRCPGAGRPSAALRGEDVLKLELAGHVGMPGWELLQRAAGGAAARARCSVISRACC